MSSSLSESLNDAIKTPWKAFAIGSGAFALVLAIGWLVSGDDLNGVWLLQLWLVPSAGLCCAGMSARLQASRWRRWLSRLVISAFLIVGICSITTIGPLLDKTDYPVMMLAVLAGVATIFYHAVLGTVACMVSAASSVFVKRHRLTS